MKADLVIKRYMRKKKFDLSISMLADGDEAKPLVLIEGNRNALSLLGELLIAVAQDADKFSISPDGPGNSYFDPRSPFGVYIHAREHCAQ